MLKKIYALALAVVLTMGLLTSCGGGDKAANSLSGTYADATGSASYTFEDGKVTVEAFGTKADLPLEFEVKDGKLYIGGAEIGTVKGDTLTIQGVEFKKK